MVPYAAYLRVYEPLSAFDAESAARWDAYATRHAGVTTVQTVHVEQRSALVSAMSTRAWGGDGADEPYAYLCWEGSEPLVCPADVNLRSWLALARLVGDATDEQTRLLVSPKAVEQADAAFLHWRAANPDAEPHIRQAAWQVPPVWFVLFGAKSREAYSAGGFTSQRLRTAMPDARRKLALAHALLRRALADEPVVERLADLGRWLEAFHPFSVVELDYAGLAQLEGVDIATDGSVEDIATALEALSRGSLRGAYQAYTRVTGRWQQARMHERAN